MSEKKKILYLIPLASDRWNKARKEFLERYLSPGYELEVRNVAYGGETSLETLYYTAVTVPYILEEIMKAERDGFDAVIVDCFSDPGVHEGRELVNIPVVGPWEASIYVACMLGFRIAIITVGATYRTKKHGIFLSMDRLRIQKYGLSNRIVSIRTTGQSVQDCEDKKQTLDLLYKESVKAIEEDGAEVIVLGCTAMAGLAEELQKRLDVPVVDPTLAALKVTEMLLSLNLKHSRLAYPSILDVKADKVKVKYPPTLKGYSPK